MIVLGPLCSRSAHYPGVPNLPMSPHLSVSFSWTGIVCLITLRIDVVSVVDQAPLCVVRSLVALNLVHVVNPHVPCVWILVGCCTYTFEGYYPSIQMLNM